jgi:precorrin-6Y C5,15-methyltransferase (decarboxylating)
LQPNIVILQKKPGKDTCVSHETYIGMPDSHFRHHAGLITKSEIRTISLSKLKLFKKNHILWDVGAGAGSVGIEVSFHIPLGRVYAIEKNPERIDDIAHNVRKFNCHNVEIINAAFPEGIKELKQPDRIFIGGGGKYLGQIIKVSAEKIAPLGVIVINTVLLQNLEIALTYLKKEKIDPEVIQIQISRSKEMPFGSRLEALNPVWIISGSKSN